MPGRKEITLNAIFRVLTDKHALLVHFSERAHGGTQADRLFPNNMIFAVLNQTSRNFCCSTVHPGLDGTNYWGWVGLIMQPLSFDAIVGAMPYDDGSLDCQTHIEVTNPNITIHDLEKAIGERAAGQHNEVVVRNSGVVGLYIHPEVIQTPWLSKFYAPGLKKFRDRFPSLPIYSSDDAIFFRCSENEPPLTVAVADIYGLKTLTLKAFAFRFRQVWRKVFAALAGR